MCRGEVAVACRLAATSPNCDSILSVSRPSTSGPHAAVLDPSSTAPCVWFCGVCITFLSQRTLNLAWWQQVIGASACRCWDGRRGQAQSQLALEQNSLEH